MYFVVFLQEVEKLIVIPPYWIKDGDTVWEKFVNYGGVHTNQKYLCYYKRKNGDFTEDEGTDFGFEPNFATSFANVYPSVELDAVYYCKIERYFYGKYFEFSFQTQSLH